MYLLLRSKGLKSSKADIDQILETYFIYGFVEDYFVDTRKCIPIKFLVSIPFRFLEATNVGPDNTKTEEQIEDDLLPFGFIDTGDTVQKPGWQPAAGEERWMM
jgi:hypothetical protein